MGKTHCGALKKIEYSKTLSKTRKGIRTLTHKLVDITKTNIHSLV